MLADHRLQNNNNTQEPKRRPKNVSRCFPIHATIISLCKGKVEKLFESLLCLRIQAPWSDVRRLYSLDMQFSRFISTLKDERN